MARWLLIMLVGLVLTSCGHRGPVRPLGKPLPAAPEGFTAQQQGQSVLLAWTAPNRRQDGSLLDDLASFSLERAIFEPGNDCPECDANLTQLAQISTDFVRQATRIGSRYYYRDRAIRANKIYRYWVSAVTDGGVEGSVARAKALTQTPPLAPVTVQGIARDRHAELSWSAADDVVGYNIYRRVAEQPFDPEPRNDAPLTVTEFTDFEVENDKAYGYAVRSVRQIDQQTVESELSATVTLTPARGQ